MPTNLERGDVRSLIETGASLIEVLSKKEFEEEHLPGAIHISLKDIDAGSTAQLDRDQRVIVYCWDYQ